MRILTIQSPTKKCFCQICSFIVIYLIKQLLLRAIVPLNHPIYAINIEEFTKKVQAVSLQSLPPANERRQYFRIKNSLFMSYQLIEKRSKNSIQKQKIEQEQIEKLPFLYLLKELNNIKTQNKTFLNTLLADQTSTTTHICQLNDKVTELAQYLVKNLDSKYKELLEVNLSGGGIRFQSEGKLTNGQKLKLHIVLVPEYHNMVIYGQIVNCQKSKTQSSYEYSVTFDQIQESDRDAIIKHIFRAQSKQLRSGKENTPSNKPVEE